MYYVTFDPACTVFQLLLFKVTLTLPVYTHRIYVQCYDLINGACKLHREHAIITISSKTSLFVRFGCVC